MPNYLQQILQLIREKYSEMDPKEAYEKLESELEKENPDEFVIEMIKEKLQLTEEDLKKLREEIRNESVPLSFKRFVNALHTDRHGKIAVQDLNKVLWYLKEPYDLDVQVQTYCGITLLHVAVGMGSTELAKLLLERGVSLSFEGNWRSPLHWHTDAELADEVKTMIRNAMR
jgi:hypothetical protein